MTDDSRKRSGARPAPKYGMPRTASSHAPAPSPSAAPPKDAVPKEGFIDIASFLTDELERGKEVIGSAGSTAVSDVAPVNTKMPSTQGVTAARAVTDEGEHPSAVVRKDLAPVAEDRPTPVPATEQPARTAASRAPVPKQYEDDLLSDLAPFVAAAVEVAVVDEPQPRDGAPAAKRSGQHPIAAVAVAEPVAPPAPAQAVFASLPLVQHAPEPEPVNVAPVALDREEPVAKAATPVPAPVVLREEPVIKKPAAPVAAVTAAVTKDPFAAPPAEKEVHVDPTPSAKSRAAALAAAEVTNARSSKRLPFEVAVTIHSEHNFYAGLSLNISEGGLFVATHQHYPVGTRLEISVLLPGDDEATIMLTEVRWVRPHIDNADGSAGIGLRFVDMSPALMARVSEFVQARSPLYYDEDF